MQKAKLILKSLSKGIQLAVCRYVLDIRNNGGGLFPAGVDVARMFLQRGDIVLIADSQVPPSLSCMFGSWASSGGIKVEGDVISAAQQCRAHR